MNSNNLQVKLEGLKGEDADSCFADVIDFILEKHHNSNKIRSVLVEKQNLVWRYLDPNFDPHTCPCTYTCVWTAFEAYFDSCVDLTEEEEEDRTNTSVKWLHALKTKVANLEAVDDLFSPHPYAQHRGRFEQIRQRLDEITEFVMHKFRCSKFGV